MSALQPAIELDAVTKRFGTTTAIDRLSLQVQPGQVLGLLGLNGAGKSTLMKLLMGLLIPDAGNVRVLSREVMSDPLWIRQRVGYVPEQHFFYRWMRVSDVLSFCQPFYEKWNDHTCRDLVRRFALPFGQRVQHLSKGMLTKLSLVLAMAHEPDVLILDEPMAGLDALVREELVEGVLGELSKEGRTMILSSHTFSDVHRLADVIAIVHEGRLLIQRPTADLLMETKRIRAVLKDGQRPRRPEGAVCERIQGREWLLTVSGFDLSMVESVRAANQLEQFEVLDLGLEEIFKDYIRGEKDTQTGVMP